MQLRNRCVVLSPLPTPRIRGEAFNLLNQVNYENPDSTRTDGAFGSITAFFPPRQLQVAAKLIF